MTNLTNLQEIDYLQHEAILSGGMGLMNEMDFQRIERVNGLSG